MHAFTTLCLFGALSCFSAAAPTVASPDADLSAALTSRDAHGTNAFVSAIIAAAGWRWSNSGGHSWGHQGAGQCTPTSATLPTDTTASTPLPSPSGSLTHVLLGRGVQNYTCASASATETPTPVGALAALYDASCIAAGPAAFLPILPDFALQRSIDSPTSGPNHFFGMQLIGHHYFTDAKSPVFNLDTDNGNAGYVAVSKSASQSAPEGAMSGVDNQGDGAVAWLYLAAKGPSTEAAGQSTFSGVYRVNTAGGNPPDTCDGMPNAFSVQYAAEYWFYV